MPNLSDLLGIKPAQNAKLKKANVDSIETLLKKGATPKGRAELQSVSGIKSELIHEWVNRADLLQIKGIGAGYSELLVKAGVQTVVKLADHDPKELHSSLVTTNSKLGQVARLPSQNIVETWVKQAKTYADKNSALGPTGIGRGRPLIRQNAAAEPAGTGGGRPGGRRRQRTPG